MRRGTARRLFAVASTVVLVASCSSPARTEAPQESGTLVVHAAGTLAEPFEEMIAAFRSDNPGLAVESRFGPVELDAEVDVLGVTDYSLVPDAMFEAGLAEWYVGFVANRITFAYTDRSAGADELRRDNWYEVLSRRGVRIGLSDPDDEPAGYQVLSMLHLARDYYGDPNLVDSVLANSTTVGDTRTELLPALAAGELDYVAVYRSDALSAGLRFVELPDEIDMSEPEQAPAYAVVSVPTSSGVRTGKPIVHALTVPTSAPNPEAGLRFVEFVLGDEGQRIMRDNGFTVLDPPLNGGGPLPH